MAVKPPTPAASAPALERVGPESAASPFWAEHRSRYRFAAPYVEGAAVLDVACGEGWGGPMLLEAGARSVLGVDSSPEAVAAAAACPVPGMRVELGDACELPVADRSIDVVVSFETLEHLERPARFLGEVRRVLTREGLLLLSTPNAAHTRPVDGVPRNPFHVREYSADELEAMLRERFASVELRGQRVHPRLRPCPYWERPELRSGRGERARSLLWKLLARLPQDRRERVARRLLGHPLLPGEDGFVFDPADVEGGHVLVAVCR